MQPMKRVLVCGGRNYKDYGRVEQVLAAFEPSRTILIHGAATGADQLVDKYARSRKWKVIEAYPADWIAYGRRAGPIRNRRMLKEGKPDLVIAFPGGAGTKHMVRLAQRAGIETWAILPADSAGDRNGLLGFSRGGAPA